MSLPIPLCSFLFWWSAILCILLYPIPTLQTTVIAPVSKDKSTNLFTLSIFLKTPLRPTKLYLDLDFLFPWTICDANYNSSSFHEFTCDPTFCAYLGFGALSCNNCSIFNPPDPNCVPSNLVCGSFPENPVTRDASSDVVLVDTLALPTTHSSLLLLPNYTFSCAHSTLLKGLPKNVTGLAALGRSNVSFQAQISASLSSPLCFAICFPSSYKIPGIAFLASTGPYYAFPSKIDLSQSLTYTPLLINPVGVGDTVINYGGNSPPPSDQYFIGLTSIKINGKGFPINESLLTINEVNGFGGTRISIATAFTLLESSIYESFTDTFLKEAASSAFNLSVTTPTKPFNVCYSARDLTVTNVGPLVPTVDLVLHDHDVVWRIHGANSMVRVTNKNKGVDLWCLGFVDGGVNKKTPIVIGGKQLEDNLVQFDLEKNRLGFTSSLLSRSLSCANFNVTDFAHQN